MTISIKLVAAAESMCPRNPRRRWAHPLGNPQYLLSDDGHIFLLDDKVEGKVKPVTKNKTFTRDVLYGIRVVVDGKRHNLAALVLESFNNPRPSKKHRVNYLNEDKTDIRFDNLSWGEGAVLMNRPDSRRVLAKYFPSIPQSVIDASHESFTVVEITTPLKEVLKDYCESVETHKWAIRFGIYSYMISDAGHCISLREKRRHDATGPLIVEHVRRHAIHVNGVFYGYKVTCGRTLVLATVMLETFVGPKPGHMGTAKFLNGDHSDIRAANLAWVNRHAGAFLRPVDERPVNYEEASRQFFKHYDQRYLALMFEIEADWHNATKRGVLTSSILSLVYDALDEYSDLAVGFAGAPQSRIKALFENFQVETPAGMSAQALVSMHRLVCRFGKHPGMFSYASSLDAPVFRKTDAGAVFNPVQLMRDVDAAIRAIDTQIKGDSVLVGKFAFRLSKVLLYETSLLNEWVSSLPDACVEDEQSAPMDVELERAA